MVEPRKLMHKDVVEKFHHYPIFRGTQIPFLAEIEKMGFYRQPVGAVAANSPAAQRYRELWQELWDRSEQS